MKKLVFTAGSILCAALSLTAQNLQSALNYCTFNRPGAKPYVETYLMVRGETARFVKNANGKYQGNIEVVLSATRGDSVFYADKYVLNSPELDDTTGAVIPNFIDKHNLPLGNGVYLLELSIADLNRTAPAFKGTAAITIAYPDTGISMSDIMAVESFTKAEKPGLLTKSGYDFVPYVSSYYPDEKKELTFYTEVYNTDKKLGVGEKYVVNTYIESADYNKPLDTHFKTKVYTTQPVGVVFTSFDISKLPSGNYYLTVDVRDKKNNSVGFRKLFFQRSSGFTPTVAEATSLLANAGNDFEAYLKSLKPDTLKEYIRSLRPIASPMEQTFIDNQLKKADSTMMRNYFKNFWETNKPGEAFKGWADYMVQVRIAQREFGTAIRKGYMTDRGRVFLQYGPPNNRTASPREPSAYPYEVWHYYRIGTQNNRRFIFYNPDLVTNDYILLHSDANGEPIDDQWQLKLHKRDTQTNNFDTNTINGTYGSRSQDLFINPR